MTVERNILNPAQTEIVFCPFFVTIVMHSMTLLEIVMFGLTSYLSNQFHCTDMQGNHSPFAYVFETIALLVCTSQVRPAAIPACGFASKFKESSNVSPSRSFRYTNQHPSAH